ncbi:MAG: MarR family winged helix-turn-helix transcriptional regulator [Candidatus Berkiella sp.]
MKKKILKQHIGYWLNRLRSAVHYRFEERLATYGVSVPAWCIMTSVYDDSAHSINELAEYIEIDKAAVSRLVDKLVHKGLLLHEPGKDRRSGNIRLTAEGQLLVPKLIKEAEENEKEFFGYLSVQQQKSLQTIFNEILTKTSSVKSEGWLLKSIKL